ncbi:hypothetical protein PYW08_009559 [Mythimna loreyi]|uniref:Uncharacterized protein n=1 Tax=Mythimna loreyi TaxID=667449 RepID=A0ACC2Q6C7_9NEOP|nr:hypothetical protein PYW08_009559 [Mythimna loreyi]
MYTHHKLRNIKMIIQLLPLVWFMTIKPSRSALVIDSGIQNELHLSDYCPNMKHCREGSHVMCMYYNPLKEFGPRCYKPHKNVKITADIAGQILDVVNTIRSKVATGKETGRDEKPLPRGYGIFRLKWDSELATFAQVYANQCMLKHDMCRATKRFPNPSQLSNILRFTHPDWKQRNFKGDTVRNLTDLKLVHAVTQGLKAWYNRKIKVTEYMVKVCPDFVAAQNDDDMRDASFYLSLVQGSATHMGCGLSQYSEYFFQSSNRNGIYNTIHVVCNLSHGYRKGTHSYETSPPIPGQGYSAKCGCPPGSQEDADCLCNEVKPPPPPEPTCPFGENSGHDCDSTLVLLPIFTMEDAPPEKLYQVAEEIKDPLKNYILQRVDNTSTAIERRVDMAHSLTSIDMFDLIHGNDDKNDILPRAHSSHVTKKTKLVKEPQQHKLDSPPPPLPRRSKGHRSSTSGRSRNRPLPPPPPPRIPPPPPPPPPSPHAHENKRPTTSVRSRPLPKLPLKRHGVTKKASIFTRVAQFKLPKRRMASPPKMIKKDVAPRKDFSNLNKVVNEYLKRRPGYKIIDSNHEQHNSKETTTSGKVEKTQTEVVFDTGLNNAEETVINFNQHLSQKNISKYLDKNVNSKDDNDRKLLSLLDKLEQEVKHIALDGNEKDLFDAKIRKIYGSIVGNTALSKFPKSILLSNANQEIPEIDFGETKISDKVEPDHEDGNHLKVSEEAIQPTRYKVDKGIGRLRKYNPSIQGHKWKNKFIDSFDQKKFKENIDGFNDRDITNNKQNKNSDFTYGDINQKHMDNLDHKYKENINKKYSENHLDQEYNDEPKLNGKFHQQHYDLDQKYDEDEPVDDKVFRELELNSHSSQEETTPRNFRFKDSNTIHNTPDIPLITKDREKRKKNERKHRNRIKSLNARKDPIDPLSIERRKYYQEKLDNIKKKLQSRRNRGDHNPRNERSMRRMHTKTRETARTRTKSLADNFYMPERARFLHGF